MRGRNIIVSILVICALAVVVQFQVCLAQTQSSDNVTIRMALEVVGRTDLYREFFEEFQKETGIRVVIDALPEAHLHEKVLTDFATGRGSYDIVSIDSMFTPQYSEAQWLLSLDEYIKRDNVDVYELFKPALIDILRGFDGKIYGFPYYGVATIAVYRKDVFEEKGISLPTTMQDWWDAAAKATDPPGLYGFCASGQPGQGANVFRWTPFFRSMGGIWFDKDWHVKVNNEAGIRATNFYTGMLRNFGPPGVPGYDFTEVAVAMQQGKIATMFDATDWPAVFEDPAKSEVAGKLGYFNIPKDRRREGEIWAAGLCISTYSSNKEAAWEVLKWMNSKEMISRLAWDFHYHDISRPFIATDPRASALPWAEVAAESFELANPDLRPRIIEWNEIGDILGAHISAVTVGKDAKAELDIAAQEIEKVLMLAGYYDPKRKAEKGRYDPETGKVVVER
jgi:multiple sugar transport system substrate-binding protein